MVEKNRLVAVLQQLLDRVDQRNVLERVVVDQVHLLPVLDIRGARVDQPHDPRNAINIGLLFLLDQQVHRVQNVGDLEVRVVLLLQLAVDRGLSALEGYLILRLSLKEFPKIWEMFLHCKI